jgi:adenosylcobinamide kinase/adenosylcobinamide-phosphate guanylyltransferase
MGRLIFILGGARSGKSDHAQELAAAASESVLVVATAQGLDDEMQQRIAAHRRGRPKQWTTLELPTGVGQYVTEHPQSEGVVVLDCLTLLVSNIMLEATRNSDDPDQATAREAVVHEIRILLDAIRRSKSDWIVVSNEVGQGMVPAYAAGRLFRDLLGSANKEFAKHAAQVIWMVAGIPVPIGQYRAGSVT